MCDTFCKEKCLPTFCPSDILILNAVNESYLGLQPNQVDSVTNLIFNPQNGLWVTYKNSGCKDCDNLLHAKIFAQIIPLAVHMFLLTTPDDSDLSPADISYTGIQILIHVYVHFPCICDGNDKMRIPVQEVFLSSFTQLNTSSITTVIVDDVEVEIVDAIFVTATVRNTLAFLNYPCTTEIAKIVSG